MKFGSFLAVLLGNVYGLREWRLRKTRNSTKTLTGSPPTSDVWVKLSNFENIQYMGEFTVGGQVLPVVYDTGSFEVIVMSDLCTTCDVRTPIYSASRSGSFQEGTGLVATHVFGSGPVTSKKGIETVIIGDSSSPLVANQMPFWQVMDHEVDVWDKYSKFSGIIGLGHSAHAPNMDNSTEDVWTDEKSLLENVGVTAFSICLERSPGTPPGWMVLGPTAENAQHDSMFVHVPVVAEVHWGVQMTHLAAGGQESFDACHPSCGAIVDSGTSLIAAPTEAMNALAPVFNNIDPDCSNLDSLPDITFQLGGGTVTLPPAIYVIKVTGYVEESQNIVDALFGPPRLRAVTQCVPAFMEVNMKTKWGPVWILGMPFLRYYYTVFQRDPKSLHVAFSTAQCSPSTSPSSIYLSNKTAGAGAFTNSTAMHAYSAKDLVKTVNVSDLQVPQWAKAGLKSKKAKPVVDLEF